MSSGPMKPLILSAECLWSRFGFGEGDPFDFEDLGPDFDHQTDPLYALLDELDKDETGDVLELLIRRHLLPEIERRTGEMPKLSRIRTSHNTVRDARLHHGNEHDMPSSWLDIDVRVSAEEVEDAVREIMKNKENAR